MPRIILRVVKSIRFRIQTFKFWSKILVVPGFEPTEVGLDWQATLIENFAKMGRLREWLFGLAFFSSQQNL